MDSKELQFHVERRYLLRILELSNSEELTPEIAQGCAQALISMRPWNGLDDAVSKTQFIAEKFPLFTPVYEYIKSLALEDKSRNIIDKMHEHLKSNNVDEALAVALTKTDVWA